MHELLLLDIVISKNISYPGLYLFASNHLIVNLFASSKVHIQTNMKYNLLGGCNVAALLSNDIKSQSERSLYIV